MRFYSERIQLTKEHDDDAGLDIRSAERVTILPLSSAVISTGLFLEIPKGHVGLIWSRSGLSCNYDLEVGAGCIDLNYRGEVKVHLYNHSKNHAYTVDYGDKIAQLLTLPINLGRYTNVESMDELTSTDRGNNGFGSTDIKEYEVWSEGYSATGDSSPATFHGTVLAKTFKEACDKVFENESTYNKDRLTLWGCKLFDNESDARRNFG